MQLVEKIRAKRLEVDIIFNDDTMESITIANSLKSIRESIRDHSDFIILLDLEEPRYMKIIDKRIVKQIDVRDITED